MRQHTKWSQLIYLTFKHSRDVTRRTQHYKNALEFAGDYHWWENDHQYNWSKLGLFHLHSVFFKYLSFPNSNFPGPFLRKLPLIHVGIVPLIVVGIGSGVSSIVCTRAAMLSSPLPCGHRCQLGTERGQEIFIKMCYIFRYIHALSSIWTLCPHLSITIRCAAVSIYSFGPLNKREWGIDV